MGFAGGIKHYTFPLSNGAIRPNTGADDTCTSGTATYSEDSEYMAVLTHRVVRLFRLLEDGKNSAVALIKSRNGR